MWQAANLAEQARAAAEAEAAKLRRSGRKRKAVERLDLVPTGSSWAKAQRQRSRSRSADESDSGSDSDEDGSEEDAGPCGPCDHDDIGRSFVVHAQKSCVARLPALRGTLENTAAGTLTYGQLHVVMTSG